MKNSIPLASEPRVVRTVFRFPLSSPFHAAPNKAASRKKRPKHIALALCAICIGAGLAPADPPALVFDIRMNPPEQGNLMRVFGHTGTGALGVPVAGGFDVDGDSFADVSVSYMTASPLGRFRAGEVDLIFGDGTTGGALDTSIAQERILRIFGDVQSETAGNEIWMDDVTGDGLGDLIICRQNFFPSDDRAGTGALSILVGGPEVRDFAKGLAPLDLRSPPAELTFTHFLGANPCDRLGVWVRTGDVTGDGIADILVSADQEDLPGASNAGAVYLIRGGPHLNASQTIDLADFGMTALAGHIARIIPPSNSARYHFGSTCLIADLDGNGRGEVIAAAALNRAGASLAPFRPVGGPMCFAESSGGSPDGTVFIAWDDNFPQGVWPAGMLVNLGMQSVVKTVIDGGTANVSFGEEILGGLDYDGDGNAELYIGDLVADAGPQGDRSRAGIGYVFYNAAALKGQQFSLDGIPQGIRVTTIHGPLAGALGSDTSIHGDFNDDGFDDLAIGAPHDQPQGRVSAGAIHILFGQPGGWPDDIDTADGAFPPAGDVMIAVIQGQYGDNENPNGAGRGDTLCYSAAAGDINGDQIPDIIVNEMVGNGAQPGAVDVGNLLVINANAIAVNVVTPTPTPTPSPSATPTPTASPTPTATATTVPLPMGSPILGPVTDAGGILTLNWFHDQLTPMQFLGFAWDIYQERFLDGGPGGTTFYPYPPSATRGDIPLIFSGAYHAWVAAHYGVGEFFPTLNPFTGIAYSGVPHLPAGLGAAAVEAPGLDVQLFWNPEIYGTWHYQIIVFQVTSFNPLAGEFIETQGPSGMSLFHFVDYGEIAFEPGAASFFGGTANFTMPAGGFYLFFLRGVPWLDPFPPGDYAVSPLVSVGGP